MSGVSLAHEELVALIPRLRRYARVLCSDPAAADDLVQDTLERACARLSQWRPGSDLRAWAFAIMHNVFVSETRRPRHRFESPLDADHEGAADSRAANGDPALDWGTTRDLERALRLLPEAQLQVLLLVAFEDMSYEQVAQAVGVPVGTVMSRLFRGRARLRELLEPAVVRPAAAAATVTVLK